MVNSPEIVTGHKPLNRRGALKVLVATIGGLFVTSTLTGCDSKADEGAKNIKATQDARERYPESALTIDNLPLVHKFNDVKISTDSGSIGTGFILWSGYADESQTNYLTMVVTAGHVILGKEKGEGPNIKLKEARKLNVSRPQLNEGTRIWGVEKFRYFMGRGDLAVVVLESKRQVFENTKIVYVDTNFPRYGTNVTSSGFPGGSNKIFPSTGSTVGKGEIEYEEDGKSISVETILYNNGDAITTGDSGSPLIAGDDALIGVLVEIPNEQKGVLADAVPVSLLKDVFTKDEATNYGIEAYYNLRGKLWSELTSRRLGLLKELIEVIKSKTV